MLKTAQITEMESKTRVRGPALETLADVRRQAKRLYAEHVLRSDGAPLDTDRLRIAVSLLGLIKSTILAEQECAPIEPGLKGQVRRLNRQMTRLIGPPAGAAEEEPEEDGADDVEDEGDEDEYGEEGGQDGYPEDDEEPGDEDAPQATAESGGVGGPEPAATPPRVA